ncbi:MAG TPA: alpha-galactosidase, partial [Lachnospiraceae bacterium]|nr:alpha-galactosidase [Lachnospiraceae bacterium]
MKRIEIAENGMNIVFEVADNQDMKLLHFSALPFCEKDIKAPDTNDGFRLVEMNLSGFDRPGERHGNKYIYTAPGYRLKYVQHSDYRNTYGRKLEFKLKDEETNVHVISHMQFYDKISVVRCFNEVINQGSQPQTLEYISSFNYTGIEKEGLLPRDQKMLVKIPHNSWQREMNWKTYTLVQAGLSQVQPTAFQRSSSALEVTNTGHWSTKKYLPMGFLENTETGSSLFWQIEHNGSWHWEIADQNGHLYLNISGPNEIQSHWFEELQPGDSFTTVPAAVGVSTGFDAAMAEITKYRRTIRRKNADNESLKVIFNDYMNCLWADPTTEKEFPLIDAAAEAGCEYFCIDAGWYAPGIWWDAVGEWKESRERFPNGMKEVTDYIRSKGMIPGVWLEIEV